MNQPNIKDPRFTECGCESCECTASMWQPQRESADDPRLPCQPCADGNHPLASDAIQIDPNAFRPE